MGDAFKQMFERSAEVLPITGQLRSNRLDLMTSLGQTLVQRLAKFIELPDIVPS